MPTREMHAGVGIELLCDLTSGLCSAAGGVLVEYIRYVFLCVCMYIWASGSYWSFLLMCELNLLSEKY